MKRWFLGVSILLLALAGHVVLSYLPRARQGAPGRTPVAALLADQGFPAAVWVPYPHQNLAHLERIAGAGPASLEALARLAGLPSPVLPTFGPLALPPSSEIAIASDEAGERWVVLAQVYPAFAAFARLGGRLADNPWLGGGEVLIEGRRAEVAWQGSLWSVTSAGLVLESPSAVETFGSGLAWIRIRQAVDPLPAGLYRFWEDDSGIGIASGGGVRQGAKPASGRAEGTDELTVGRRLERLQLFMLVFSGRQEALGEPARSLAFFDQQVEQSLELPRIASLYEPGAERWPLPGESLLELAGREPRTAASGGWEIAALDSASLERARLVAPELESLARRDLKWGLWLDLGGGLAEVERIARTLDSVPIVPRRQVEGWNDARTVLTPLTRRYSRLEITVAGDPQVFELRLYRRRR